MKIERVRYRGGRPYIEYWVKNRKYPTRCFGEIRKCKKCGCSYFAPSNNIKKGHGLYCSRSCHIKSQLGKFASGWKGGKTNISGYVYIYQPQHPHVNASGYVAEHRLIIERKIGRYLLLTEVVHHKNGIRDDNREENLTLFTNNEHGSYHHKGRVYIRGQKHQSKYRREYGKTLGEMAKELGISLQGVFYRLKKGEKLCV